MTPAMLLRGRMRLRLTLYRVFFRVLSALLDRRIYKVEEAVGHFRMSKRSELSPSERQFYWVHASSAGELEGLEPIALALGQKSFRVRLTIFSPSAQSGYLRLKRKLEEIGAWEGGGLSPMEGAWYRAFRGQKPLAFITAKYEAWPELWASASSSQVPIFVLGAQLRCSLRVADFVSRFLIGIERPKLKLAAFARPHKEELIELGWSGTTVFQVRDPRWDQVLGVCSGYSSPRLETILTLANQNKLPRPWGVIGNAWMSDFRVLPCLATKGLFGRTLLVIPHEVKGEEVKNQERLLITEGWKVVRTSILGTNDSLALGEEESVCILVDEVGVLKGLYRDADRVYVGGGFGRGLHSVMEPVVSGAPIFAGPTGIERFVEVEDLILSGDLCVVQSDRELRSLVLRAHIPEDTEKDLKLSSHQQRMGGTSDVLSALFGA